MTTAPASCPARSASAVACDIVGKHQLTRDGHTMHEADEEVAPGRTIRRVWTTAPDNGSFRDTPADKLAVPTSIVDGVSTPETSTARGVLSRAAKIAASATSGPQRPLEHLATVTTLARMLDEARDLLVAGARDEGASWSQIGSAMGISRQAARQRWGVTSEADHVDEGQEALWPFVPTSPPPDGPAESPMPPTG